MIEGPVDYRHIQQAVASGLLVVFAAGTVGGEPTLAWMACLPPARSARFANHPDARVRAAQAVGAIAGLGRQMRRHGFTPA